MDNLLTRLTHFVLGRTGLGRKVAATFWKVHRNDSATQYLLHREELVFKELPTEFDDAKFYNIPSFMETDKGAQLNNREKVEKMDEEAKKRKEETTKKKARTMLEFIEYSEINTDFCATRKTPAPMGDRKSLNFLTINSCTSHLSSWRRTISPVMLPS